jgi:hypothetical protein
MSTPEFDYTKAILGWRKRGPPKEEEDWDNSDGFKRLKLSDAPLPKETPPLLKEEKPSLSQALIPLPVALPQESFKLAVALDFPDTNLGRLLRSSTAGMYEQGPFQDLLKQAAYLDEREMELD